MTKRNKSRDTLIEAASRLFRMHGYHSVGVADIVKESETAKGSLYYYFPNGKEELVIEAINHTKDLVVEVFYTATEGIEDPVLAIQSYVYNVAEKFNTKPILGVSIATIAGETALTNEVIRNACMSVFKEWQFLYKDKLLESGYSDKEAEEIGLVLNAMIEGGILLSLTEKTGEPLKIIADRIPSLFVK